VSASAPFSFKSLFNIIEGSRIYILWIRRQDLDRYHRASYQILGFSHKTNSTISNGASELIPLAVRDEPLPHVWTASISSQPVHEKFGAQPLLSSHLDSGCYTNKQLCVSTIGFGVPRRYDASPQLLSRVLVFPLRSVSELPGIVIPIILQDKSV
jgi:hypothetical protein